jgi:hypothetical protein
MESQIQQALTYPSQAYAQSFFAKLPTDARFLQVTHQKFVPSSTIDSSTIEFCLDRYDAANCIMIQDTYCEVTCVIVQKDNVTLPLTTAKVSVVNNVLHSLFESVRLIINDVPIRLTTQHSFDNS